MKTIAEMKEKSIELRVGERKSIKEIAEVVKVHQCTIARWVKQYPLTKKEIKNRKIAQGAIMAKKGKEKLATFRGQFSGSVPEIAYSDFQKGNISEAAVRYKCLIHNMEFYIPPYGSSSFDAIVHVIATGTIYKLQIRTAQEMKTGFPQVSLRSGDGSRYTKNDFDFLIGYDIVGDGAYIWSFNELKNRKCSLKIEESARERWDKILKGKPTQT